MSDHHGDLLMALDAVNRIVSQLELVKMAMEQASQPGPKQLDRIYLLLDLYQDAVSESCEEASGVIQSVMRFKAFQ